ncbi:p25-alpha [Cooperia oncophora]
MTGKNFDKWLKDAGVLDSKNITTTMTGIAFSKVAGPKKKTNFEETKKVIVGVAEDRARQTKRSVQGEADPNYPTMTGREVWLHSAGFDPPSTHVVPSPFATTSSIMQL